jgi:hypothetical protein
MTIQSHSLSLCAWLKANAALWIVVGFRRPARGPGGYFGSLTDQAQWQGRCSTPSQTHDAGIGQLSSWRLRSADRRLVPTSLKQATDLP